MLKNVKRVLATVLAGIMVCSLAACKKEPDNSSSDDVEVIVDTQYQYITESGETVSGDNSGSSDGNGGQSSGKVNPKNLKGTTVRYATWKDPELNEDGPVVKAFEKKYGINVDIDFVGQSTYNNTILGMIASGNSPDVYFCNMFYPSCLTALQPIDAAKLDLTDPIWDQSYLDLFTVNNKTYLVTTLGNVWNSAYCLYFNKTVLKQAGFTENQFPDKLYEKGLWTWDALETIMSTVKTKLGNQGYLGGFLDYDAMINSVGCNLYNYKGGKFTANTTNANLIKVNERLADWYTKGYIKGFGTTHRDEFLNGKVALAATSTFGLKKTGYWAKMNQDSIGFTYLPDYDDLHKAVSSGLTVGWGIIKGAKNPEGAGLFLRYYLDGNNYDTSNTFMNDNAATFFFEINSGKNADKQLNMIWNDYTVALQQPSQVRSTLASMQNSVNEKCNTVNTLIETNTAN